MAAPEPAIFREKALQRQRERREQGVLLRLASPPVFALYWLLLLLLLGAGALAWSVRVPISLGAQGVMSDAQGATALLFFAPGYRASLRVGQPVQLSVDPALPTLNGVVASVSTDAISPDEARARFHLQGALAQAISAPSIVVSVRITTSGGTTL